MDSIKQVHLVCNAHLDPVWLWTWEEGLVEALSTYRIAADFCDEHQEFVFVHNESLLYGWVKEHDPALFKRIQKLESAGRWRIGGGAYLQPDMNGPGGESHIRQFLLGRQFLESHFSRYPRTAYNFDPFGHPASIPQILSGCGMERYVFCRPDLGTHELPVGAFRWRDRSGAEVIARRSDDHYLTNGKIREKLAKFIEHYRDEPVTMLLWGIGNHGGGPSRAEYRDLKDYIADNDSVQIIESDPDSFFDRLLSEELPLPVVQGGIQDSFPGCYTSAAELKRIHREVEQALLAEEARSALRWWDGHEYPADILDKAWRDLLFIQFHDILPGSSVRRAESESLDSIRGLRDRMKTLRIKGLIRELDGEDAAEGAHVPLFMVNPHGFAWNETAIVELQLDHRNGGLRNPEVTAKLNGRRIPLQRLGTETTAARDWRIRLALPVKLKPWQRIRLELSGKANAGNGVYAVRPARRSDLVRTVGEHDISISPRTGLLNHFSRKGEDSLVKQGSMEPVLYDDLPHSWTCGDAQLRKGEWTWSQAEGWSRPSDRFRLAKADEIEGLSPTDQVRWRGKKPLAPVRVIEDGPLLTVVEAVFVCNASYLIRHYSMAHRTGEFEMWDRVFLSAPDRMLKHRLKLASDSMRIRAECPHGMEAHYPEKKHQDRPHQRWLSLETGNGLLDMALEGCHAHSLTRTELGLSLMRSPPYASMGIDFQRAGHRNHFRVRQAQGWHEFRVRLIAPKRFNEAELQRQARSVLCPPSSVAFFPSGSQAPSTSLEGPQVDRSNVVIVAVKRSEDGNSLIVRVQECAGRRTRYRLKLGSVEHAATIEAYRLQTWRFTRAGDAVEVVSADLVERPEDKVDSYKA